MKKRFGFPINDAPDTAVLTCCHVLADGAPILHVSHDADDGMWQFLCGRAHGNDEARVVSLAEIVRLDGSTAVLADMPCGCTARRKWRFLHWKISK